MRVKLKTTMAGPGGVNRAGSEITVSAEQGSALVDGGYAEKIEPVKMPAPETATAEPDAERAVTPPPKKRKRAKKKGPQTAEEDDQDS